VDAVVDHLRNRLSTGTSRVVSKRSRRSVSASPCPELETPVHELPGGDTGHSAFLHHAAQDVKIPATITNPTPVSQSPAPPRPVAVYTGYAHETVLAPFERRRSLSRPLRPEKHVVYYGGTILSDEYVVFTVPDGWSALLQEQGFRLSCGPCLGFIRATASADASAALCDTSQLAILDKFDVSASPIVDAHPDVLALVVDYRNHGAGRGVAVLETGSEAGAVVFGLAAPAKFTDVLLEAERELLCSSYVIVAPPGVGAGGGTQRPSSPQLSTLVPAGQYSCRIT
jgi:hypothetical protein